MENTNTTWTMYDGNKTLPVVNATAAVSKASSLYSSEYLVAVVGDPSSRFMLIQSGKLMEYGSDTGYMVSTVVVTGPAAGTVKEIPVGFVVKESLGYKNEYHPAPYPSSGWGPNRPPKSTSGSTSSGGSSPNVGIIIAVVVLILIAVAAVFAVVRNRRKKVLNAKPPADGAADPSLYTQGPIYPQPVPQNAVPQPMPHFAQAGAYSPVAGGPMPTTGAAPNPTMPTTSTVFGANPPVFSTHPRPNIVTTVSSDPSATSSASYPVIHPILGQDPSAVPWTPTPFDPHAGTATPSSIPSSAAFGSTTNPSHALSTNSPALPSASPSASAGSHPVSIHGSPVVVATPNSASQTYYSAVIADRPLPTLPQDPPTQIPVAASPPIPTHSRPSNPQARAD
ncbi:hypothetical protein BGZ73_001307 [Actinomortierella ambigua]|nr:hypothetical protein BGZ73_001307 [Actinomortierella ambigua]